MDWGLFPNLNLNSLGRLDLEYTEEEDINTFLDMVLSSGPKDIKLSLKDEYLISTYTFLTHKLLAQVVDLSLEFG
jgi:hypothetical protein